MNIEIPVNARTRQVSEDSIKDLSKEECIALRKDLQKTLAHLCQTNPGQIAHLLARVNERLFEVNYRDEIEFNEAY